MHILDQSPGSEQRFVTTCRIKTIEMVYRIHPTSGSLWSGSFHDRHRSQPLSVVHSPFDHRCLVRALACASILSSSHALRTCYTSLGWNGPLPDNPKSPGQGVSAGYRQGAPVMVQSRGCQILVSSGSLDSFAAQIGAVARRPDFGFSRRRSNNEESAGRKLSL